jgi:hypothetical protein
MHLELKPPIMFEISDIVRRLRNLPVEVEGKIEIKLPFVSISDKPDKTERKVAREVVIRLGDRRGSYKLPPRRKTSVT